MTAPISILLFGRDTGLLETRRWVLEAAGCKVHSVSQRTELDRALLAETFDVLVLCHSVPVGECVSVAEAVCSQHPFLEVLALSGGETIRVSHRRITVLDAADGPAKLISLIGAMARVSRSQSEATKR